MTVPAYRPDKTKSGNEQLPKQSVFSVSVVGTGARRMKRQGFEGGLCLKAYALVGFDPKHNHYVSIQHTHITNRMNVIFKCTDLSISLSRTTQTTNPYIGSTRQIRFGLRDRQITSSQYLQVVNEYYLHLAKRLRSGVINVQYDIKRVMNKNRHLMRMHGSRNGQEPLSG